MKFEIEKVGGIAEWERLDEGSKKDIIYTVPGGKVFCVVHNDGEGEVKTVEVRTDGNLAKLLRERYESVMEARYFGRGGVEVVAAGQIPADEIYDLVRLSYTITTKKK